jgi:hypothetical protein
MEYMEKKKIIMSTGTFKHIHIYHFNKKKLKKVISGNRSFANGLAYSGNNHIMTTDNDEMLKVYNLKTGKILF